MLLRLSDLPQIERPGGEPLPLAARDAALLAWLAVEGPTSRDRLGALLWPGSSESQARNTLRQRLFQLKKALGADIATGSPTLALAPGVEHDLGDAAELLGELTLPDAPDLDAWLRRQRELRRGQEHASLRAQIDALEAAGEADAALQVAQALLRLQPLSEPAHQRVMRLHYLLGDRAAALAAFDACEQMLKHELATRPSANTLALLATVERADAAPLRGALRALPAAVQRPPAMVGREQELQQLAQAWPRGQVAVVIGEAGLGKSRLLAEFMARRPGVVRAAARPGDAGMPFATLVRLLRAVGERGAAGAVDADTRHQLARVMPELASDGAVFAEAPRQVLQQAVACWLQALPAITGLLLDDLHFADDASLEMLQSLLADSPAGPPRWALAYRGGEAGAALLALQAQLAEGARLARVEIAPLDAGALADLVDQLDLGWSGAAVAAPLLQRTGGNPLFLLETLKQAWLEPGAGWPKPESVERLLDRRIAKLAPAPLALARVAAIAGSDFSIELAAAVLGGAPLQQADALNELEAAQVLRGPQFTHDLVFDAVLRSVPQAIAQHGHAQVAAWLEAHQGEPACIATHWFAAGQAARAPRWLGLAARQSMQRLRNAEALAFLESKADAEAEAGDKAAAFDSQVEAVTLSLDVDLHNERATARCERLMQWAVGPRQQCHAQFWRTSLAFRRYDIDAPAQLLAVLSQALALSETRLAMECRVMLTLGALREGRPVEALRHAQACVDWVEAHGGLMRRGELQTYLALLQARIGSVHAALIHHDRAIAIARELGVAHHVASVLSHRADTLFVAGRSQEALVSLTEALDITLRHQTVPANTVVLKVQLSSILSRLGHFRRALQAVDDAEMLCAGLAEESVVGVQSQRGFCWAYLGQWGRLQALLEAWPAPERISTTLRAAQARLAAALDKGLGRPARPGLADALALLPESDRQRQAVFALDLAPLQPPAQALAELEALRNALGPQGFDGDVNTAHVRSAQIALATDPALAREHALLALAGAEGRDLTCAYRGELWLHCARALQAAGDTARAAAVLAEGQAWVRKTAAEHVPDEFRESFLHRNPTNAALLAMVIAQDSLAP